MKLNNQSLPTLNFSLLRRQVKYFSPGVVVVKNRPGNEARSGLAAQRVGRLQMFHASRLEAHKIAMPPPFMSFKVYNRTRKKPCSASPSSRDSLPRSYSRRTGVVAANHLVSTWEVCLKYYMSCAR